MKQNKTKMILEKYLIKFTLKKLKTIADFDKSKIVYENNKRSFVKVCIIDDEGFIQLNSLNSLGYTQIDVLNNFNKMDDLISYDVILCDIDGIGKNIDQRKQGIAIAEQILINFPEKSLFIYSGKDPSEYGDIPNNIEYIPKQTTAGELTKILDQKTTYVWNPVNAWDKMYHLLLSTNTDSKTIAMIEHNYVNSLIKNKNILSSISKSELFQRNDVVFKSISIGIRVLDIFFGE